MFLLQKQGIQKCYSLENNLKCLDTKWVLVADIKEELEGKHDYIHKDKNWGLVLKQAFLSKKDVFKARRFRVPTPSKPQMHNINDIHRFLEF